MANRWYQSTKKMIDVILEWNNQQNTAAAIRSGCNQHSCAYVATPCAACNLFINQNRSQRCCCWFKTELLLIHLSSFCCCDDGDAYSGLLPLPAIFCMYSSTPTTCVRVREEQFKSSWTNKCTMYRSKAINVADRFGGIYEIFRKNNTWGGIPIALCNACCCGWWCFL